MIENRKMQYLYAQGDEHVFMDMESYDQTTLAEAQIEDELQYLLENMELHIQSYQGELIGIELPNTVVLEVAETEPGLKAIQLQAVQNQRKWKQA